MRKKLLILGLIFLVFISIAAVSANENETVDDEIITDVEEDYDAEIVADDSYTTHYFSDDDLTFGIVAHDNNVEVGEATVDVYDNKTAAFMGHGYFDGEIGYVNVHGDVGTYKAVIVKCDAVDNPYKLKPTYLTIKITKAPVKLTASKWISTTKQYTTLKATVKDEYGGDVFEGTVKFTINGKSYKVKVRDGVAIKKVKLTKAKTYTYKAEFSSKNYKTKTVSSKVYVKKAKKYYTFKVGKYKAKFTYNQYTKIIKAKNNKKSQHSVVYIGKYKNRYAMYFYIETIHKDGQVKKGDYLHVWANVPVDLGKKLAFKRFDLYATNP